MELPSYLDGWDWWWWRQNWHVGLLGCKLDLLFSCEKLPVPRVFGVRAGDLWHNWGGMPPAPEGHINEQGNEEGCRIVGFLKQSFRCTPNPWDGDPDLLDTGGQGLDDDVGARLPRGF